MKWSSVSNVAQGPNKMMTKRHLGELVTKSAWTLGRDVSVACG